MSGIRREYDEFINSHYNKAVTKQGEWKIYADYALQLVDVGF